MLLVACAPPGAEPQPPEIAWGQDICDACGMIIDQARYAAATLLDNGETRKFDDIGDMFAYHAQHPELPVRVWFVHDYESEKWVRGESAYYVVSAAIKSPMGHQVAAFGEQTEAEAFASTLGASVLTFDEMRVEMHVALDHSQEDQE